jgi:hypothetical protein
MMIKIVLAFLSVFVVEAAWRLPGNVVTNGGGMRMVSHFTGKPIVPVNLKSRVVNTLLTSYYLSFIVLDD